MDRVLKKIPPFSVFLLMLVMVVTGEQSSRIEKRQIFREAVLPSRGGVIPEGAFTRQRLQHNINDQLGVQAPDGHIFISRDFDNRFGVLDPEDDREILRLRPYDLNTITHVKGLVHHSKPLATTYLLRRPVLGQMFVPSGPRFRNRPSFPPYPQVFPYGRGPF